MGMIKVSYGKSMYGGWYADYYFCNIWTGCHAKTLEELKQKLNSKIGYNAWEFSQRIDN